MMYQTNWICLNLSSQLHQRMRHMKTTVQMALSSIVTKPPLPLPSLSPHQLPSYQQILNMDMEQELSNFETEVYTLIVRYGMKITEKDQSRQTPLGIAKEIDRMKKMYAVLRGSGLQDISLVKYQFANRLKQYQAQA